MGLGEEELNFFLKATFFQSHENYFLLELIIMLSHSMRHHNASKGSAHWDDRFCGVWEDNRTADEIVDDIRSMRTSNSWSLTM